ncbi:uncharacterized protein CG5098 [Wyeomyia smithii]|uniref:uncharacterized protein CG5098 n=1 Tax=Wyeomyia smithii TaxID=174621 RepID=UPI002467D50D|nr:uncharacterized protein CG5098 [Wyeomyia smithii]XP_055533690.1 uncharacterized protein CG5098 [Wyeomyia smithii]
MSGHNPPHGRLGQPNSTWNPLQVPSYIPRQPQLAHMSSERSLARSPLTWHTPPTHQDQLYSFMTANHKNNLDINPMLPSFGRGSGVPLGSVDLSLSSASRSTPSPKGNSLQSGPPSSSQQQQQHHSASLPQNIPPVLGGPSMPDQNDHFHPKMIVGHGPQQQQHHMNTNHNRSPSSSQMGSVIQSTAALKDRSGHNMMGTSTGTGNIPPSCSFLGSSGTNSLGLGSGSAGGNGYYNMLSSNSSSGSGANNNMVGGGVGSSNSISNRPLVGHVGGGAALSTVAMGVVSEFAAMIPGGLHIKDAKQINNETSGRNGRDIISTNTDSSDLVKDILMHAMQSNQGAVSPKHESPMRVAVPPFESPKENRRSSPVINTAEQSSVTTSTNKSFSLISGQVPSTPEAVDVRGSKDSSPQLTATAQHMGVANRDRASPNQSITSNEDSADSNSSKSRRRRKPDRTNKMDSSELERMHEFLGGGANSVDKCDRIDGIDPMRPNIAVRNDIATLALEGISSLSQGLASDSSHSPHITDLSDSTRINLHTLNESNSNLHDDAANKPNPAVSSAISSVLSAAAAVIESAAARKDSESTSDDCETIDKIAAMISSTEMDSTPAQSTIDLPLAEPTAKEQQKDDNKARNSLNGPSNELSPAEGSLVAAPSGKKTESHKNNADESYEEIENKLEEMFAGIEETLPSCSKLSPLVATKRATSPEKPPCEPTDIIVQLSEKPDDLEKTAATNSSIDDEKEASPSTSATQKKVPTPASKRASTSKPTGAPPNKRKKVLKKKPAHSKAASFAAAEERANNFGAKFVKKLPIKGNGKKGNASGNAVNKNVKMKPNESLTDLNGKYKGPFIHVKSDGSHTVINTPTNEDDMERAQNKTKKFTSSMNNSEKSKIRGLHVSTLSTKYDADTTDTSWMCVFCKVGPHKTRLGDLFGPYIISTKSSQFEQSQTDVDYFSVKRTRESLASKLLTKVEPSATGSQPKSKKKKISDQSAVNRVAGETQQPLSTTSVQSDMFHGMIKAGDDSYEVWMHEDCLVWAPGVHIIGTRIVGLEAAIWNCCRHQCRLCSQQGAMVSCLHHGCSEEAHVVCARSNNWMLTDDFKSHCSQHSKLTGS